MLSRSGREVTTVLAWTHWLMRLLQDQKPEFVACCFDESLHTGFRHQINACYKRNRALPDEELAYELLACKKIASYLGIATFASEEFEADDLIAALARLARLDNAEPWVLSRDKDLAQILMLNNGRLWDYSYSQALNYQAFKQAFDIAPERIAEYLAIVGDRADNISGVHGIGKKSLSAIFSELKSWQQIKTDFTAVSGLSIRAAKSLAHKLQENEALIDANLALTHLRDDCLSDADYNIAHTSINKQALLVLFDEFKAPTGLYQLLEKLC